MNINEVEAAMQYLATNGLYLWRKDESSGSGWGFAKNGYSANETWPTVIDAISNTLTAMAATLESESQRAEAELARCRAKRATIAALLGNAK